MRCVECERQIYCREIPYKTISHYKRTADIYLYIVLVFILSTLFSARIELASRINVTQIDDDFWCVGDVWPSRSGATDGLAIAECVLLFVRQFQSVRVVW